MSDDNFKVTKQIFHWFEKMKSNYEKNISSVLEKFEKNSEIQNIRIDKANQALLDNLQNNYTQQLNDKNVTIEHLNNEIGFYKEQFANQQKALEQLNTRYDAVMHSLLSEKSKDGLLKDIFENNHFDSNRDNDLLPTYQKEHNFEVETSNIYSQAVTLREEGDNEEAFTLFMQAAIAGDPKSMGAVARAYFLNEGIEEDKMKGLAWLINASEQQYQPAIKKCEHFKKTEPEFYAEALIVAEQLTEKS
jgi:TPR repeat protein